MGTGPVTRAVFFTAPGRVEVRTVPLPPRKGRVLVTSTLQGISAGSEMLFYRGTFPSGISGDVPGLSKSLRYPVKYGYSNVGVDEAGRRVFGFFPHQEAWYAGKDELVVLPEDISDDDAVFLPNMETALGIVQDIAAVPGESVVVMGLGVVGILTAEILRRCHYGPLLLADIKEGRRKIAESLGAEFINPAESNLRERIDEISEGRGADRAVNVSASAEGLQALVDSMGEEGTVVEASWYGDKPVSLLLGREFHRRRLVIRSFQVSSLGSALGPRWTKSRRLELAVKLLREIRPGRYITHRHPFSEAGEAYGLLDEAAEDVIQVVLTPE